MNEQELFLYLNLLVKDLESRIDYERKMIDHCAWTDAPANADRHREDLARFRNQQTAVKEAISLIQGSDRSQVK